MSVINGKNAILGRLATHVAKELLKGEKVSITNAEDVIITGDPKKTVEKFLARRSRGSPHHGPFYPRKPDMIVRRAVRGMLPKTRKGRDAFRRLHVHIATPEELKSKEAKIIAVKEIKTKFISVGKLSKSLGWN